jgi:hypothetical protein
MFCTSVDEALVQRSSVLQALREAGQHHSISGLPEGIEREDFFLWAGHDPDVREAHALPQTTLCSILKVRPILTTFSSLPSEPCELQL